MLPVSLMAEKLYRKEGFEMKKNRIKKRIIAVAAAVCMTVSYLPAEKIVPVYAVLEAANKRQVKLTNY